MTSWGIMRQRVVCHPMFVSSVYNIRTSETATNWASHTQKKNSQREAPALPNHTSLAQTPSLAAVTQPSGLHYIVPDIQQLALHLHTGTSSLVRFETCLFRPLFNGPKYLYGQALVAANHPAAAAARRLRLRFRLLMTQTESTTPHYDQATYFARLVHYNHPYHIFKVVNLSHVRGTKEISDTGSSSVLVSILSRQAPLVSLPPCPSFIFTYTTKAKFEQSSLPLVNQILSARLYRLYLSIQGYPAAHRRHRQHPFIIFTSAATYTAAFASTIYTSAKVTQTLELQ
ncbi:hypothetical protein E4U50_001751 [Claviceps purpurea]|nr:hypothetical protein E4U28_004615 [Claviceps purpurea]KAG6152318.1 hypothetical protein E4U11_007512 [Claviceps purpurea]KAG6212897.1 hypothetical protein E4U50_001751 [Claviceps purpurea]